MLKKIGFFIFFTLLLSSSYAQKTAELGILVGRSYYLGEVNPKTHWGNGVGSFTLGGVFKYNLNERYTLKAALVTTKLGASDDESDFPFNNQRLASFESRVTEFSGTIEFNFLPYEMGDKRHFFTPYLFVGLSYYGYNPNIEVEGFVPEPIDEGKGSGFAYPFGTGMKLSLGRKFALAAEWGFRKTGNDLIDGLENRINDDFETGKPYDNDWFVVTGFMLTYKLTNEGPCPVYNF